MVSHLILVRHGESKWNLLGLWTGWVDIELSERGREEARQAARVLTDITIDLAFTSDLKRAKQTVEIIIQELGYKNLKVMENWAIKERNYGIYAGKNKWEIRKKLGEVQFIKLRRGWDIPIPQGESLKDVYHRVYPYYEEFILPHLAAGKNVLISAHGNSIRALIKHIEKITDKDIAQVEIATGEVLIYKINRLGVLVGKEKRAVNPRAKKQ